MMTRKPTRRRVLTSIGAGTTIGLAGCLGGTRGNTGSGNGSGGNGSGGGTSGGNNSSGGSSQQAAGGPLTADGSSTVYPITSDGAAVWNSNPPADDEEYWGPGQYGFETDEPMADFFGGIYGFESGSGEVPFSVNVGLSHSGTGIEKLMSQQVDIADSSAPVQAELPDRDSYEDFVDHVVGVDGQPVVVSQPIYDAGVTKLTGEQLKAIYRGEITKWQEIDAYNGPDKEIQAICRAEGSGTDTAFRTNLLGDPNAPMECDSRIGQNQQVKTTVQNADNAIAYIALAFVGGQAPAIALEIEGTTYELGKNLGAEGYPLSRDLHCYTWQDTSKKEAAFINMLLTEYGQTQFVEANNYFKLPPERRTEERDKLPEPNQRINYGASGNASSGNSSSGGNSSS